MESEVIIPDWVKQIANFWITDQITNVEFVKVIEYLIQQKFIIISYDAAPTSASTVIPNWIKTNTQFWLDDRISDVEFSMNIEWLINNGIIRIS